MIQKVELLKHKINMWERLYCGLITVSVICWLLLMLVALDLLYMNIWIEQNKLKDGGSLLFNIYWPSLNESWELAMFNLIMQVLVPSFQHLWLVSNTLPYRVLYIIKLSHLLHITAQCLCIIYDQCRSTLYNYSTILCVFLLLCLEEMFVIFLESFAL
jgi:hypothetical protein